MDNNMQCLSDAHIAEVLKMLPYVSREDVKKDLAITNSVELTINRILDGQLTQESSVASGELSEDGAAIKQDDSPPHYTLSTARVTTVSSFACELPSPPKKRKFVFRQIDRSTAQKRNDFYSDSSDVELNDVNEQCEVELNHDTLGSASVGVNLNNLSDDDTEQTDQMKLSTHGCCVTEEQQVYKSEKPSHIVQYISSDEDVSEDGHTETVEAHCAVESGYSCDYSKTSSHVNGFHVSNAMSRHLVNCSSAVTETCDDLPDLNMDSGSCFSHGDSQTSTQSTTLSQTSVFSESGSVTSTSCLNSQDPELPTLGCARKLAKTSEKATGMQKMEREKTKAMKKEEQERRRKVREEERVVKQQKREEVQREKAFEKSKKQAAQAARRQVKPGECLKFMTAVIDPAVLKTPGGSTVLETLQKSEVKYEIVPQPLPNTVTFWREVTEVTETEPLQLQSHTREVVEKQILLVLPLVDFIELVHATQKVRRGMASEDVDTLTTYMQRAQDLLEGRQITLLIQGLEGYFRDQKTREDRAFRGQVLGNQGVQRARSQKEVLPSVTRLDVEEVLLDLQMHCQCNVKLLETDAELGKMVLHYTRAIAETPFKLMIVDRKDRLKTCFTFHVDKKWCVKVDKEGHGLATLWRQQLQQFKNVSADMANAIVAEYPSPWLLYQAYKKCPTNKSAEELLQDILVRRGAGVLSTSRRIGKELSRRIHQILTVTDPSYVIS